MVDMALEMESIRCNLCKGSDLHLLYSGHDNIFLTPYAYRLVRCNQCGLVFVNPRPKEMSVYYRDRACEITDDGFSFLDPDRVKLVQRYKRKGAILDVACGHGYFLM